jgi:hypothetical protein
MHGLLCRAGLPLLVALQVSLGRDGDEVSFLFTLGPDLVCHDLLDVIVFSFFVGGLDDDGGLVPFEVDVETVALKK